MYPFNGIGGLLGQTPFPYRQGAGYAPGGPMQQPYQPPAKYPNFVPSPYSPIPQPSSGLGALLRRQGGRFGGQQDPFAQRVSDGSDQPEKEKRDGPGFPWITVYRGEPDPEKQEYRAVNDEWDQTQARYDEFQAKRKQSLEEDRAALDAGEITWEEYHRRREQWREELYELGEEFDDVTVRRDEARQSRRESR